MTYKRLITRLGNLGYWVNCLGGLYLPSCLLSMNKVTLSKIRILQISYFASNHTTAVVKCWDTELTGMKANLEKRFQSCLF